MTDSASQRLESLGYRQELNRTMSLSDVVVYGLIYMVPLAPLQVFGFIYNLSAGMVAAVYVVAAVAMYFSAVSYCEMAKEFPVAGSVYSYVRFGTNEFVGFISGWAILLDYLLLPGLLFIFAAAAMHLQIPAIPELVWVPVFVVLSTVINVRGIVFTARVNLVCLYIQLVVLAVFVIGVAVALYRGQVHLSLDPLYQRGIFSLPLIFSAIPIAALSYIGFDAISTLNEEAKGGGEMVSRATMIVLVAVAAMFVLQVYLAALFEPRGARFDADTAVIEFFNVANVAVGPIFKTVMTLVSALIAILANAIVSQATTSRLIFSMARDGQIPRLLSAVDPRRKVPIRAIILVAILSTVIGLVAISKSDLITSIVTFGSLAAYSLLHVAVIRHFTRRGGAKWFAHVLSPLLGLATLLYVLWSTPQEAKYVAGIWFVIGLVSFAAGRAQRLRRG
ncbi:MAG TPA: APC family permease [Steroidobacteraceae bacterium]|jgi:amino acid transporter|nr:APC family permease [Steroidobacteraceae bacterium]